MVPTVGGSQLHSGASPLRKTKGGSLFLYKDGVGAVPVSFVIGQKLLKEAAQSPSFAIHALLPPPKRLPGVAQDPWRCRGREGGRVASPLLERWPGPEGTGSQDTGDCLLQLQPSPSLGGSSAERSPLVLLLNRKQGSSGARRWSRQRRTPTLPAPARASGSWASGRKLRCLGPAGVGRGESLSHGKAERAPRWRSSPRSPARRLLFQLRPGWEQRERVGGPRTRIPGGGELGNGLPSVRRREGTSRGPAKVPHCGLRRWRLYGQSDRGLGEGSRGLLAQLGSAL